MRSRSRIELGATTPGNSRWIEVERFGDPGARPRVYLQAGLHADELPSVLVLDHLRRTLAKADLDGRIRGEIVVVPFANPVGLAQWQRDELQGRFDLFGGGNFNRGFPNVVDEVADAVDKSRGDGAKISVGEIRRLIRAAIGRCRPANEAEELKQHLLALACDADIALDLHCDSEAIMHLYLGESLWPLAEDLHRWTRSRVTMLADDSGDNPFDETVGGIWWALAGRFPDLDLPPACLSATIEYRGESEVFDAVAERDADNLYRFLCGRGVIDGERAEPPQPSGPVVPFTGVEMVRAPSAGVVAYHRHPGDRVQAGEVVATISDPSRDVTRDAPVDLEAPIDGLLFGRASHRFARPGLLLFKIAGDQPLPHRAAGSLLND